MSLCSNSELLGESVQGIKMKGAVLLGIALFLLPGLVVSLATKYQRELKWGLGYLPTYMSAFGLLTLSVVIFVGVKQKVHFMNGFRKKILLMASTVVGLGMVVVNFMNNSMVVHAYNVAEHCHRSLMERASSDGFLQGVPEGSFLVFGPPVRGWDEPAFYKMHSGLTLQVVKPPGFEMDWQQGVLSYDQAFHDYSVENADPRKYDFEKGKIPLEIFAGYSGKFKGQQGVVVDRKMKLNVEGVLPKTFFVKYWSTPEGSGYVALGNLKHLQISDGGAVSAKCDKIRLYVKVASNKASPHVIVSGQWFDAENPSHPEQFSREEPEISNVTGDDSFKLFELKPDAGKLIDVNSLNVELSSSPKR